MHPLLSRYRPATDRYDELMQDASGVPRAHWRGLIGRLQATDPALLRERWELLARQVQENGVTYNVYADPKGDSRPWELDLLPQLIPADEWELLAAGVAQRARLMDRVLADIYGPQTLLNEGLLPPELIFGHGNFLWPMVGVTPPGETWLHVYAVDLARAPDGRWWVLADRTQTPAGAGYALENRQIVARAFPELYRELRIRRLDGLAANLRETLMRQAGAIGDGPPLVVLLTPGRYNETYFEHAYLARQLGFPLVEGQDLTVRECCVYLKTLDGLQRVHAILRRLDDDWCDPLELRGDSVIGVPGLLEALRAGKVVVANGLGAGVLESPGLLGFMPAIAERVLGESLSLPALGTWWCGEEPVLRDALRKLPQLTVSGAFPGSGIATVRGASLDRAGMRALRAQIRQRPYAYVAQEQMQLSQAPVWAREGDSALVARAVSMRVFAVATAKGYQVMPGGLTRVVGADDSQCLTIQRGGGSKDTWVFAGGDAQSVRVEAPAATLMHHDPYLLSRTVENLYWLGRYCERCDGHARLLRSLLARHIEADGDGAVFDTGMEVARRINLLPRRTDDETDLLDAIADLEWSNSLHADLRRLGNAAAQVRARMSMENWRAVMALQRDSAALESRSLNVNRASVFLNRLLITTTALSGFALDDMTRDDSWRFLMVGRSLERVRLQISVLTQVLRSPRAVDPAALDWLLELGNSTITYRTRYLAAPQLVPVLDLLLLDEDNPRAVVFQLDRLLATLSRIPTEVDDSAALQALPLRLREVDLTALEGDHAVHSARRHLLDLLEACAVALREMADRLSLRHFAHVDDVSQSTVSA